MKFYRKSIDLIYQQRQLSLLQQIQAKTAIMDEEHPYNYAQVNFPAKTNVIESDRRQQDKFKQQNPHEQYLKEYGQSSRITNTLQSTSQINSQDPSNQPYTPYQGFIPMKIRNRRFKKLIELRTNGFFDEQAIKLRHPLLYYLFVSQYEFQQPESSTNEDSSINSPNLLSSFLSTHLINIEYKNLLSEEMTSEVQRILEIEKNTSQQQIKQMRRLFSIQGLRNTVKISNSQENSSSLSKLQTAMQIETSKADRAHVLSTQLKSQSPSQQQIKSTIRLAEHEESCDWAQMQKGCLSDPQLVTSMYEQVTTQGKLSAQERQIQEQHLIEYCQELFLEGKLLELQQINYRQIDHNADYDDWKEEKMDLEQKYFDSVQNQIDENAQTYYTGIQDF